MDKSDNTEASRRQVVISALSMSAGTFGSRLLGVVREMALFALFPVSITDAWSTAWRLPNLFRRLLGEGSLSVSFLPVYVRTRVEDPTGVKSRQLLDAFWTLLLLILAVLTCLGTIFVPQVLELLLQDQFQSNAEKMQLTIVFGRIMFSFIFLVSVYAFWMAVLNALGHFAWAAMAPMFFNVAMIVSTLLPQDLLGVPGETLAWGVLAGGALQAGVLIPQLLKKGVFPRFSLHFRQPEIWRVLRSMGPGLLGMGLLQLATLLNLYFASALAEGSVSYIYLADRLLELPLSLVSVSLGTALLPTLSKFWAQKRLADFSHTLRKTLFLNWFLALPAALGLLVLSGPIIEVLFRWGKFGAASAQATSHVLQVYSLTLLASSSVRVFVPAFYAVQNTWWPALVSGLSIAVHALLAPWWMRVFGESQFLGSLIHAPLLGLVFSGSLSACLNFMGLTWGYRRFVGNLEFSQLRGPLVRLGFASLGMSLVAMLVLKTYYFLDAAFLRGLCLFVGLGICGLVFLFLAYLLGIEEVQFLVSKILGRTRQ